MRAAGLALSVLLLAAGAAAAHGGMSAGGLGSPLLEPGASFRLTLDGPGTFDVHCHLHGNMTGRLVVLSGSDPDGPRLHKVTLIDSAFVDEGGGSTTTAYAGEVVEWTNQGNQTHDVHLAPAAPPDNGSFEAVVLAGLAVTLVAILLVSRRRR